jgi:hypothetical protein
MPLIKGYSAKSISKNIRTEMRAGRQPAQAAAIAYDVARQAAKRAGKPGVAAKLAMPKGRTPGRGSR